MASVVSGASFKEHTSYTLDVMTIVNNESEAFDVKNTFIQCFINESIFDNFLSGEIVIADAIGMFDKVKFTGQESLRIRLSQPTGFNDTIDEDDVIDKVFRIYKINDVKRIDAQTQVFNCSFASPELIEAKRTRISQAFKGNLLSLAAKISEDHLGIANKPLKNKLQPHFERRMDAKEEHHVIIPNWTVQETINWLCSKSQDNDYTGGVTDSFFFYQTANGGYRINSIKDMYETRYQSGTKFVYSDVNDAADVHYDSTKSEAGVIGSGRRIIDYFMPSTANILEATMKGMFGSNLLTINNTGKYYQEKSYNYLERFFVDGKNSIDNEPLIRTQPEVMYIGEAGQIGKETVVSGTHGMDYKPITSYPDAFRLLLNQSNFVHDEEGKVNTVNGESHFGGQQSRQAVSQLVKFHPVHCLLSARTDISVGQIISLVLPDTHQKSTEQDSKFHSGDHLITNVQWVFNKNTLNTNIVCIKDSFENNIELTEIEYGLAEGEPVNREQRNSE